MPNAESPAASPIMAMKPRRAGTTQAFIAKERA
jgi:hypothetical protein